MMTQLVIFQSFEMEMTAETTEAEIRGFVLSAYPGFEQIDEQAISESAWRLSREQGFVTSRNVRLVEPDEIEAYLLNAARQGLQNGLEAAITGLVWARNQTFDLSDNNPYEQGGTDAYIRAKRRGEILE